MRYRWWILVAVVLFVIGLAFGLATPPVLAELMSEEIAALVELGSMITPFSVLTLVIILVKNISAVLLSFILSPLLCLLPILSLLVNGWLLAFVSNIIVQEKSLGFVLAGVLPHGVLEIPALIIAQAAALNFGVMVISVLFRRAGKDQLWPNLYRNLRYLMIACALLLPAAIIETYLTPLLLT